MEFFERFSLPVRYAIFGFVGGIIAAFLGELLMANPVTSYMTTPFATAVGGYIGGLIRQRRDGQK